MLYLCIGFSVHESTKLVLLMPLIIIGMQILNRVDFLMYNVSDSKVLVIANCKGSIADTEYDVITQQLLWHSVCCMCNIVQCMLG